jgi:PLP dependent protein
VGAVTPIADYLNDIEQRIARAAEQSGRSAQDIRLVAVTKTQPIESVREALAAGVRELGENYVQEAEARFRALWPEGRPVAGEGAVTRHLIGHLQRNKAARAVELFDMVQSVHSQELARALGRAAAARGRTIDVLIQVNISGEATKSGVAPEEALDLAGAVVSIAGIRLRGLMGIGPLGGDETAVRASFQLLARLFGQLPSEHRDVLSMGMTDDFEWAIAQGSTMVRVGTGIFGPRRSIG